MSGPTGWEQGCHVVIRLKQTAHAARALGALANLGLGAKFDQIRSATSAKIADTLAQSDLRRLLAGNTLRSIRTLFAQHPAGLAAHELAVRGVGAEALSSVYHAGIAASLRGHLMLDFPTARAARAAIRRLAADPLVERVHLARPRFFCADPLEGDQWGHAEVGPLQRASSVTVAVIDTGVDANHPDLADIVSAQNFLTGADTAADADGHGTHCIGVLAAKGGNGFGVRGVCRPNMVLSMRVGAPFDSFGYYNALENAVSQGAHVISLSLAGDEHDPTEEALVRSAVSQGVVVCAAIGNEGTGSARYPAALSPTVDGVIAVGAMTPNRTRAGFSNTGSYLDLMAPGVDILSTFPVFAQPGAPFKTLSGTSMSTPFVAGAAAVARHKNPTMSPKQIRQLLRSSAQPLAGQVGRTDEAGFGCVRVP